MKQNNRPVLNRKEWQMMNPSLVTSAAGTFMIKDPEGIRKSAFLVTSATSHYIYATDQDAWMLVPSMALGGTFGAGACGTWVRWSNTLTATGGTTDTITLSTGLRNDVAEGRLIRFLTGANAGLEARCSYVALNPAMATTIKLQAPMPNAIGNGDTFVFSTGRYVVMSAGTLSATSQKTYDPLTGVVTNISNTGLPATWGTDGKMAATPSYFGAYATGTATGASSTTIQNTAKNWAVNQWCNYQVRITAGTGIGQVRTILSNTATQLTVAAWATTPDLTSQYAIEANDDFLYLFGNGAVTAYRYSFASNTWTTLAPTTARAAAPGVGMGANWAGKTGNEFWADENNIQDGRYIYSPRGGASSAIDRFDITGGTNGAGAWAALSYIGAADTYTTGSSFDLDGDRLYMKKDATNRINIYSITGNYNWPFAHDQFPDSTAVIGDKMFTVAIKDDTGDTIKWLYYLMNTGIVLRRIMIF